MNKRFFSLLLIIFCLIPIAVHAQETSEIRAVITNIVSEEILDNNQVTIFEARDFAGNSYRVDTQEGYTRGYDFRLEEGTEVVLQVLTNLDGTQTIFLSDVVRTHALFWMLLLFSFVTIAVGWRRGAFALVGLVLTLLVLFMWIMPAIIAGSDPVLMVVLGGSVIMLVNMHLVHGFTRKTFVAFISIVIGLFVVWGVGYLFSYFTQLTGLASEDSALLYLHMEDLIVPKGILLAGIILGALGVFDDVAVTQQEAVSELLQANKDLNRKELYNRAMRIGRHHIASAVNTLVLAYTGAAFPLFLLFYANGVVDWMRFINTEIVAEEIVRTLAGTTALLLLVPISTWFAVLVQKR
ncbi:MAG: hypothetical protein ACD_66C00151G0004 [uncultured bacterium]|uniref:YibE/F family protein n=1 Tax=Candidatus Uhrbacteria bacterium GW2011_GWC1_41_20 TaxID=1618983 RepID=A0A0G0XL37_9BACT|nr:MAG: hypothetical protein ACD_66C00151G0004 [uncultured bacterium]KKR21474.1 MAG: YibE/F family protein [Candidatus Uhrbacteria bacterium GW2011_GWE1_39_46]KKR63093.1 MAG: YibE/F family protein [Candidatus Uhrbacteria bacterium GW2011_GWC2_40_450]KKR89488.1 MAG: YibE/F family protein [Candidatus Uhrbacteria bacterium GW2011_GWD2_41_121]KKR89505.1 MAG: YibE/F family protein [Candidatus Uhrbacteria bacterium GW2011_GWE2_41_1153]KKR94208.1 MAG: YibE/F family protein [Candidatus Uhrbacteria bac